MPSLELLQQPSPQIGMIVSTASLDVADVVARAGFDWLFLDTEHGSLSLDTLGVVLSVVQSKVPALVRIPDHQETSIKKALDAGADGIIVPQVNSAEAAEQIVQHAKYAPLGTRSVGITRAHGYGADFASYVARANETTAVIVQIEHIDAVENIDDIVSVAGVDGLFIGPYDLSASLGCIGDVTDDRVQEAIGRTVVAARQARIPVGVFAANVQAAMPFIESGYDLVAIGIDMMVLGGAARETAAVARATV